jgi:hypothetical protein
MRDLSTLHKDAFMPNSEFFLAALFMIGVISITAIASKSSALAEFSAGRDGIRFRFDGHKVSESLKIDTAKSQDETPVPPSLEL